MRISRLRVVASTLLILAVAMFSATFASTAAAKNACQASYEAAITAVDTRAVGMGDRQKLRTKVVNAWRKHQFDQPLKNSLQQLDVGLKMLDSSATKSLTKNARTAFGKAIGEFRACLANASSPDMATLIVRTYQMDETAPEMYGAPVAGAYVRVEGMPVGQTGGEGSLTVQAPASLVTVRAVVPSFSEGQVTIDLAPGTTNEVRILLDDSKEVVETSSLSLLEAPEGILPNSFTTFTLQFFGDEAPVQIAKWDLVDLLDREGNIISSMADYFSIAADGSLVATDITGLRMALARQSQGVTLRVQGVDGLGFTHANTIKFRMGYYRLIGYLVAPPSNQALRV